MKKIMVVNERTGKRYTFESLYEAHAYMLKNGLYDDFKVSESNGTRYYYCK